MYHFYERKTVICINFHRSHISKGCAFIFMTWKLFRTLIYIIFRNEKIFEGET